MQQKKDFKILSFSGFSRLADRYVSKNDDFSVIGYSVDTLAAELCELAMQLIDNPLPQTIHIPAIFQAGIKSNDHLPV